MNWEPWRERWKRALTNPFYIAAWVFMVSAGVFMFFKVSFALFVISVMGAGVCTAVWMVHEARSGEDWL